MDWETTRRTLSELILRGDALTAQTHITQLELVELTAHIGVAIEQCGRWTQEMARQAKIREQQ